MTESTVAMTRWRVSSMQAARDRFDLTSRWRWRLKLERCRNGRTGEWLVEFDDAYRFSLAAAMADPALPRRASAAA
jgi:protein ImuA